MRSYLLALLLAACGSGAAAPEPASPVLVIGDAADGGVAPLTGPSLSLALAAMPEAHLEAVRESTSRVASGVHAAHNPLLIDLDDTPIDERREQLQRELLPSWGAASALAAGTWWTADGAHRVTIADRCPGGATCYPAWHSDTGATDAERAARRAAWPVTAALILETPTSDAAHDLAQRLRATPEPIEGIALVITAGVPAPPADPSAELGRLLVGAELLDGAPPSGPPALPPWIGERWVVLVPRLAHLARLSAIAGELERLVARLDVDYPVTVIHRGAGFAP